MQGGSSGAAAAVEDVSVNVTNDTLIEAMVIFHNEGEEACVGLFSQDARGAINIIKKLIETCKQSNPGLFDLDITMAELREELLKVNKLELSKTQIVDVAPLATLVHLTDLRLNGNKIVDVEPLRTLVNLTDLNLTNNQIVDVAPLATLVNLTSLDLSQNRIVDVSPLAGLVHLTFLGLSGGNPIVDTSPLRSLPKSTKITGVSVCCRSCAIV